MAPAPSGDLAPGRWAVQVGVFFTPNVADSVRAQVEQRLAQAGDLEPTDRIARIVKRGNYSHVVVGDAADKASAEALAARLRVALKQDVVVFRR